MLALWIGAIGILIGDDPLQEASTLPGPNGEPGGNVVDRTAPVVPECVEDCDAVVTRAEMATAVAEAFELPVTTKNFFTDDDGSPHEGNINRMASAGIMRGCGNDQFCPSDDVTHGRIATVLSRVLELPKSDTDHFGDDDGHKLENAINRVAEAGITEGCGDGAYCPDEPLTRSQLVTLLTRALGLDDPVA